MKTRTLLPLVLILGCGAPRPPVRLVAAVDLSAGAKTAELYGASVFRFQRSLPDGSSLKVLVFRDRALTAYLGSPLRGRGAFNERIGSPILKAEAGERGRGTRTDRVLEALSREPASRAPLILLVRTDGGLEDASPEVLGRIRKSAVRLSGRDDLRLLLLWGVLPEHRRVWEERLAPLGDRALVRGEGDGREALEGAR